jgi:hypothetical protein
MQHSFVVLGCHTLRKHAGPPSTLQSSRCDALILINQFDGPIVPSVYCDKIMFEVAFADQDALHCYRRKPQIQIVWYAKRAVASTNVIVNRVNEIPGEWQGENDFSDK